ncbi:MAG: rRNA ((745)-N(1))-methyltransferase [Acidobacteriota bacterium]|jgi:23S rRNA (guanine745-N1)-methyltransferase
MLLCTVRNCRSPLHRDGQRAVCQRGHSFDYARSGYLNLLQPQERRSKHPGDTPEAVAARRRLHDRGVTAPLLDGIGEMLGAAASDVVLDAGCGEGFYLGSLAERLGFQGHGIDISIPAIDAAARRYPGCKWVVGNADRFLPYADASFTHVISITARRNAPEFRRVLQPGGHLLVAVPSPEDLIELRGRSKDRSASTLAEFPEGFRMVEQARIETTAALDEAAMEDVLLAIYRPLRPEPARAGQVTFSLDLLRFEV